MSSSSNWTSNYDEGHAPEGALRSYEYHYEAIYNPELLSQAPRVVITERPNALRMFPEGMPTPKTVPASPSLHAISLGSKTPHLRGTVINAINDSRGEKLHVETGWVNPGRYVPHGQIQEYDSEVGQLTTPSKTYAPIPNVHLQQPLSSSELNSPLPGLTTPPPRPGLENKELPLTPLVQEFLSRYGGGNGGANANETGPSPLRIYFTSGESTYTDCLVKEITSQISEALSATDRTAATFIRAEELVDLRKHLEYCELIHSTLFSLSTLLATKGGVTETQRKSASSAWDEKYVKRLEALELTLQRYLELANAMPPRICKLQKVLEKLGAHHNKLADLAVKLETSFEQLKGVETGIKPLIEIQAPSSDESSSTSLSTPSNSATNNTSACFSARCGTKELELNNAGFVSMGISEHWSERR